MVAGESSSAGSCNPALSAMEGLLFAPPIGLRVCAGLRHDPSRVRSSDRSIRPPTGVPCTVPAASGGHSPEARYPRVRVSGPDPGIAAANMAVNRLRAGVLFADRHQQRSPVLGFLYGVLKKYGDDQGGQLSALVAYY